MQSNHELWTMVIGELAWDKFADFIPQNLFCELYNPDSDW